MFRLRPIVLFCLFFSTSVFGQSWIFNNNSLNNWSTVRISATTSASHLTLTTTGQNNPKLEHSSPAINADSNSYAIVKMRVGSGGPTLLRINFPNGNVKTPITTGTTGFVSYAINMTHNNWSGTVNQIELAFKEDDGSNGGGTHSSSGVNIEIEEISFVDYVPSNQTVLYVDPLNGSNSAVGSSSAPLKSIPLALDIAAANSISNVYIKTGTYDFTSSIDITTQATSKVTLSPEPNGSVKLKLGAFRNFRFYQGAKNIEVKGFELDGQSDVTDHWTLLSNYVWQPGLLPDSLAGGGICFQVENAEDIFITNNVIHDFFQKAVNIEDGRYVQISGNVIYNIGHTSLSGGHGIMRQQGSGSFSTNDDPNKYRWDINGNLIFNVHQRIYSWVPSKGYLNMTLDEGKPILIDETPNHDTGMKARISNNVIAFSKIDAIRLKPTNGLEVSNNSIFSRDSHADGITNTTNGFNTSTYGTPFLNFISKNNAVDVNAVTDAYKLDDAIASTGSSSSNNYAAYGAVVPTAVATYQNTDLFTDPDNGDFELLNSQLTNVGISQSILDDLVARADTFNVTIANDHWQHDHLKNTQTLLDNIPGVEDGISSNEPVFTDAGTYDASDLEFNKGRKALYFSINPTWKSANINSNSVLNRGNGLSSYNGKYELVVPEDYSTWLDSMTLNYQRDTDGDGNGDTPYSRIRYGASVLAQDKVFPSNALQHVIINSDTSYTITEGGGHSITLNGLDLLVTVDYTVSGAQSFDLIKASSISGSVGSVIVEGYSGQYSTIIVSENGQQILRLQLGTPTITGTNYYISPNGDDANDGLSTTNPFLTIPYALGQLSAGDTLNFMNGTYAHSSYGDGDWFKTQNQTTLFVNNLNGTSNAYITLRALPNNSPKIKGDGIAAIEIKNSSYIIVEGFEVEGDVNSIPLDTATKYQFLYRDPQGNNQFRFAPGTSTTTIANTTNLPTLSSSYKRPTYFNVAGISVKNSDHIEVRDNHVHHMPGEGIKSFDSDYLTISNNEVHDCSRRSSHGVHGLSIYTLNSIDTYNGVKVIIENNKVYDNYNEVYSWNQTKTFVNPHYDEGKGITIQRCYPSTGWTNGRILIRNNISYRNGLSGIQINVGERIDILHNTVYGNHRTTEMYGDGSQHGLSIQSGDDINVKNNIVQSWNQTTGAKVYKISANSTNITASHNIMVGSQDASSNVITSSPEFTDSTNFDFSLQSTSPAVDAGTSAGVPKDFIGNIRDASPDIGALEYVSSSNCTPNTGTDVIDACDSHTWIDGLTYTASNNTATYTLTNAAGCDSVVTLDLTINSSNTGTDVITACDSYIWIDGNTYSASNNSATYILTNAAGCDSVVTLNLTINLSNTGTDVITACDSYTWIDGNTYTASNNTATYTLTNVNGCDSVVTLDLTINSSNTATDVISACDSYTWIDGLTYTASNNTATYTLTNAAGCDSVVTLDLTINSSNTGIDVITACDSYIWIDGLTYTASNNTATYTLTNAEGCDSVVTLDLTINSSNTGTDLITACDSYTWIDGLTYTASNNTATYTLTNASGCDSVVTLDLTINSSNTGTDVITACDSYTWIDGNTYTASNNSATHTLTNINGCDSVVTLDLTINSSNTGTDVITACDSYTWIDGNTYTASNNTATYTLTNAAGCDSVVTLNLTINSSNTGTDVITACDSYTWIDGNTYTASNNSATYTLTNAAGCDSVVTLNLTINSSNTGTDVITACDSYTWIDGNTYTASNNSATYTLTNAAGCDSVVTLNLTINSSNTGTDVITACDSYTWIDGNTYTASNNSATYTLTNVAGCDSVVTLDLTIESIDATVTLSGLTISALPGYDSYQWYECTANGLVVLNNETNDSIVITANGDYTVVINNNNCSDTSDCVTITNIGFRENNQVSFRLFPNPTQGMVKIERNNSISPIGIYQLQLVDSHGKMIQNSQVNFQDGFIVINLDNYPAGVYQLTLMNQHEVFYDKVTLVN